MNATHLVKDFDIEIERIDSGWEYIKLRFDDIEIPFEASYIGREPISTLVVSIFNLENHLDFNIEDYFAKWHWNDEPGKIRFEVKRSSTTDVLTIDIVLDKYDNGSDIKQWHFKMPYVLYRNIVIKTALRQLKRYGIKGFHENWMADDFTELPTMLIVILSSETKSLSEDPNSTERFSDILSEIELLKQALQNC
ncbi:MAG: hypothetical protein IIU53_06035 [Rikenellaceae bacterium]|nr:hypothetical protein [Rikenellaceae bacterium]